MSNRWMYKAEICDGHECIADCDVCSWKEAVLESEVDIWEMTRLKPCPFCGAEEEWLNYQNYYVLNISPFQAIYCRKCGGAIIDTNINHCPNDINKAWNRRAGDSDDE